MKKPSIPPTGSLPQLIAQVVEPMKQNIEMITGARAGSTSLAPLPDNASLADVIVKINAILSRINQSG